MPGIAGLISKRPSDECRRLVEQMLSCMKHEPFYTSGTCSAPELGVFAGYVALEGAFADCQPIVNEREDIFLLFAGECFTDPGSTMPLQRRGHWLIRLYEEQGERFFVGLNGVFSGLLIDHRQRRAFLFNDRYGIERIYYHAMEDGFFFASETKALLRILPHLRAFDEQGLVEFVRYGCTLEHKTLFQDIHLLPGGSLWSVSDNRVKKQRYFVPETWESQPTLSPEAFDVEFRERFSRILPRYFTSDSEIGISLTGGLDTRIILACRPATAHGLISYTFAGADSDTLDVRRAAEVAAACRLPHYVLRISDDFFANFSCLVDRTIYMTDGCLTTRGAHEIYLNNLARRLASIRLTGNFGSEILRGVTTFKPLRFTQDLLNHDRIQLMAGSTLAQKHDTHPVSFAVFKEIPWHLFGSVRAAQSQVMTRTPYLDNDLVALAFQAPARLRGSAMPAVNLLRRSRTSLDRIPTDRGLVPASRLSSLVMAPWYETTFKLDYWYREGVPQRLSMLGSGFDRLALGCRMFASHRYLHYRQWFRRELSGYLRERLTDPAINRLGLWNRSALERLLTDHIAGRNNYVQEIDTVLTVDAIDRLLLQPGTVCRLS
jgi:asparagine synthase (glutamine-hydrolysing)